MTVPPAYHQPHQHRLYRMTCDEFDALYRAVKGRCEICAIAGEATATGRLFIDHDMRLGYHAVRGLLCNSCNTLLGVRNGAFSTASAAYLAARPWHEGRDTREMIRRIVNANPERTTS